jgi:hypothetical protein
VEANHKKILKAIVLELRHMLEGYYNGSGWHAGDLEQRLNALGVWRDRNPLPADELAGIGSADREARKVVDAYLKLRDEAGVPRDEGVAEFVRETAYTWANRLLALRCMEARELIDEIILQKEVYGGRSLEHNRLAQRHPELCAGEDDGLSAALDDAFAKQTAHLPLLFDPKAPGVALKPGVAALKRALALLSGTEAVRGQEPATSDVFRAPDAFGWAYQYWNTEEKDRVFEKVRTQKGAKIEGADIIPATQLYTESYMVKFLVQNSLGATWAGIKPDTKLTAGWEYYVNDADRAAVEPKSVREITFLDPACGSGHFLLEAFDLFYRMYEEEGEVTGPEDTCRSILEHNLYGIDIDERAVQITEAALWMKAAETVSQTTGSTSFSAVPANLVATNIRLPEGVDHLKAFLTKHPDDKDLSPALEIVFEGLQHAEELGSLLQIEKPVEAKLRELQVQQEQLRSTGGVQTHLYKPTVVQGQLPMGVQNFQTWKAGILQRLSSHFRQESESGSVDVFFNRSAGRGIKILDILAARYDVVAANPPYMGNKNFGDTLRAYIFSRYAPAKRDLYAAFVLRCTQLARDGGAVAMVTQQTWLFLRSFSDLRATEGQAGVLQRNSLRVLAHLGPRAFAEVGGEVVQVCLFVLWNEPPDAGAKTHAIKLTSGSVDDKKRSLERECKTPSRQTFVVRQSDYLALPESPVAYNLPPTLVRLIQQQSVLSRFARVRQGMKSGNDRRFFRFFWEHPNHSARWVWLLKGGGYSKWRGLEWFSADWEHAGARIKRFNEKNGDSWSRNVTATEYYFKPCLTYTQMASGSLCMRFAQGAVFNMHGTSVFLDHTAEKKKSYFAGVLNTRVVSFVERVLSQSLVISAGYLERAPLPPERNVERIERLVRACAQLKARLLARNPVERAFEQVDTAEYDNLKTMVVAQLKSEYLLWALLCSLESSIEEAVEEAFDLPEAELQSILENTGTPVGWFPAVAGLGFSEVPDFDSELVSEPVYADVFRSVRTTIPADPLLPSKVESLFHELVRGSKESVDEEDDWPDVDQESLATDDLRIPIPSESIVESCAARAEIHPISVYRLLDQILSGSLATSAEHCRMVERLLTQVILNILGYRWPTEDKTQQKSTVNDDAGGIVPVNVADESSLYRRVQDSLSKQFVRSDLRSVERDVQQIAGISLQRWISDGFFPHHVAEFKRRPIAWQLRSNSTKLRNKSTFSAFICFHKVNANTLATIQSQYVRPLKQRHETEMRGIESIPQNARSDRQQERLTELMDLISELRVFDEQLEEISRSGFGPEKLRPQLRQYAIDDAMLCLKAQWLHNLSHTISTGPLATWRDKANDTKLHPSLAQWVEDAMFRLRQHCLTVGPSAPRADTLQDDPTSASLASLICKKPDEMVQVPLKLACTDWWSPLAEAVLAPIRAQIKTAKDELKTLKEEDYSKAEDPFKRRKEIDARTRELKESVKRWERDLNEKTAAADELREEITAWKCPEARTWEDWLAAQPMYDAISGLDGVHHPPQTVAEWVAQECAYAPDINDGVRVNIAPLQKAGILAAEVLAAKDVDKAIADRAEWRADERRWCREGKLPQPGWWPMEKTNASGQD